MIPPYPAPLTVLHPVHISKNTNPQKAIELLTCKIDQITRLLHEYVRYQEPLAECIEELRSTHEQEFVDAFEALQLAQQRMQELKNITVRLREQVAGEVQRGRASESGSRAASDRQKTAATKEKRSLSVLPPSPVPPFKPAIEGVSSKSKSGSKLKSKSKSKKSQEQTELSLQLERADKSLRELLSFVQSEDHELASSHEEQLDEKLSGSRYGCFKALAANCYIVREWQREQTDLISDMWDIRAEINDMYAVAKEASDETDRAMGYTALNNTDKTPCVQLKDLNQEGDKVDDVDLETIRPTYTFTLSLALPGSKKLEKLTRAEAIQILRALPLSVSFCLDGADGSAPSLCEDGAEGESTRFLLRKSLETGQWSQEIRASGSQLNDSSQTTTEDSAWRPVIVTGKGERAYPASWKPKNTEGFSTPGELIAARTTTRNGPAPAEEQSQSSRRASADNAGAEERTQTRSKKGKSKASSATPVPDATNKAEADKAPEPAENGRKTQKRRREQTEATETDAEVIEAATSGSTRRTSKRSKKSDKVDSQDVEDDSDTKRLRKKRKVNARK